MVSLELVKKMQELNLKGSNLCGSKYVWNSNVISLILTSNSSERWFVCVSRRQVQKKIIIIKVQITSATMLVHVML